MLHVVGLIDSWYRRSTTRRTLNAMAPCLSPRSRWPGRWRLLSSYLEAWLDRSLEDGSLTSSAGNVRDVIIVLNGVARTRCQEAEGKTFTPGGVVHGGWMSGGDCSDTEEARDRRATASSPSCQDHDAEGVERVGVGRGYPSQPSRG